ncbi:Gpi ethanolamine phosphate transferase [Lasiodiplodia theobromae]|uniref:Gpi ethanolamine phosphate transferase n=1 Tax=Lasiodiplodia theobromae TaxID=45133 RepID=UPI0015C333E7|nr:Gpi ethanolamine phosphate transferase [Lasiodiplodia theobromae]KAF4543521.1 Gpi ethanolamine phosphate transferase [Lasiodiplodia theobromae]
MAKGARSSVRKTNNQNLKARVFGPVETARTERLSQKLLELAQQPQPPKNEMEVEKDEPENNAAQEKAPAAQAEGSSKCFTWPIPPSLLASTNPTKQHMAEEEVFYHFLGLSGDITGFTTEGDLAMDVDGAKPSMSSLKKKTGRVQKKRRGKATSTITFNNLRKGKAAGKKGGKR